MSEVTNNNQPGTNDNRRSVIATIITVAAGFALAALHVRTVIFVPAILLIATAAVIYARWNSVVAIWNEIVTGVFRWMLPHVVRRLPMEVTTAEAAIAHDLSATPFVKLTEMGANLNLNNLQVLLAGNGDIKGTLPAILRTMSFLGLGVTALDEAQAIIQQAQAERLAAEARIGEIELTRQAAVRQANERAMQQTEAAQGAIKAATALTETFNPLIEAAGSTDVREYGQVG